MPRTSLRCPLALLQAELESALQAAPSGSPQQQLCTSLLGEIHHLKAIIEKLLLLAAADSGRRVRSRVPVDFSAILANVIEEGRALAPAWHLESVLVPAVMVAADAVLLEQALQNVLNNAVKYNRPNGRIQIILTTGASAAVVTFGNSGPGIVAHDHGRLFERFFRGDPARDREHGAGAGLGLSLAREILRAHSGELTFNRSGVDWTEFSATLPLSVR